MNIQDWVPLGLTGLVSLQSKELSRIFSSTTVQKHQFFSAQPSLWSNSHIHTWLLEKKNFVSNVMSPLFSMLSRFVKDLLPRSKCLLISWLQSLSAVTVEPKEIKSLIVFIVSPSDGNQCHDLSCFFFFILFFWMLSFKPAFSLSSFTFIKRPFSSSSLSAIRLCHLHIWGYWYFSWQFWFQLVIHPVQHFAWCTLHIV